MTKEYEITNNIYLLSYPHTPSANTPPLTEKPPTTSKPKIGSATQPKAPAATAPHKSTTAAPPKVAATANKAEKVRVTYIIQR